MSPLKDARHEEGAIGRYHHRTHHQNFKTTNKERHVVVDHQDAKSLDSAVASVSDSLEEIEDARLCQDPIFNPTYLRELGSSSRRKEEEGNDDQVLRLDIPTIVHTGDHSAVEALGTWFPNLMSLRLCPESTLASFRDLGTQLRQLSILTLRQCHIEALDGIGALPALTECYLAYNDIRDISPLALHEHLVVLDLESNALSDIRQFDLLGTCPRLQSLNVERNPFTSSSGGSTYVSRILRHYIPQLVILDDIALDPDNPEFKNEAELYEWIRLMELSSRDDDRGMIRAPLEDHRHYYSHQAHTLLMEQDDLKTEVNVVVHHSSGSKLTHGTNVVFAGNVTSALRRRKSEQKHERQEFEEEELVAQESSCSKNSLIRRKITTTESILATLDDGANDTLTDEDAHAEIPISHTGQIQMKSSPLHDSRRCHLTTRELHRLNADSSRTRRINLNMDDETETTDDYDESSLIRQKWNLELISSPRVHPASRAAAAKIKSPEAIRRREIDAEDLQEEEEEDAFEDSDEDESKMSTYTNHPQHRKRRPLGERKSGNSRTNVHRVVRSPTDATLGFNLDASLRAIEHWTDLDNDEEKK